MGKNRIRLERPLITRIDMYEELFVCTDSHITVVRIIEVDFDGNRILIQTMDRKKIWVSGFWLHLHAIRIADLN